MRNLTLFLLAFASSLIAVQGQDVVDILNNYYQKIGGVEKWKSLNSIKMEGTSNSQGMEFPIIIYLKRPNLEKVEIDVQGMQIIQSFDGETSWSVNPFSGNSEPQKADEMSTEAQKQKNFEDELIDYEEKGSTLELIGSETVNGKEMQKLKLTRKEGDEMFYYFDPDNNLPAQINTIASSGPMKGQAVETYVGEYREIEGMMFPTSISQKVNGMVIMESSIKTIEVNAEIDSKIFAFPDN